MPMSMLACPAEGHFAPSEKKIDYLRSTFERRCSIACLSRAERHCADAQTNRSDEARLARRSLALQHRACHTCGAG